MKKKAENKNGRELTLSQWAKAAGMSRISLDKILCNGRESRERIIRCYRRLVICIATSYQGRGLSMQDLIQVLLLLLLFPNTPLWIMISCNFILFFSWQFSLLFFQIILVLITQEGNLGLIRGAKKFNPQKGYKLSTYVYWWIRQAISRAIAKKSKITRLPVRT